MKSEFCLAAAAAACLWVAGVHASTIIGISAVVDKVTFEPNADHPQRIRIEGAFMIWPAQAGLPYPNPEKGYLYFSLPEQGADQALREWADMKSVAGARHVVGLAQPSESVKVHKMDEKAEPTPWPLSSAGVVKMTNSEQIPVKALLEFHDK